MPAELLEEDARRVPDLRCALAQEVRVLGEQCLDALGAPVRLPVLLSKTATDRLAIEIEPPCDLRDRHLLVGQPANLLPAILTDHRHLPRLREPGRHRSSDRFVVNRFHWSPLGSEGWGDFAAHEWGELHAP